MEMTLFDTVILAFVQGITEFLPISSSGHLVLAPVFFGFEDPGLAFSAGLHLGTLGAVVLYFWRDLVRFAQSLADRRVTVDGILGRRYIMLLALATLPAMIFGLLFEDVVAYALRAPLIVVGILCVTSVAFWLVDAWARRRGAARTLTTLSVRDTLVFGVLQAIAVIPGVSRSGATILAGRLVGFTRHDATRFSFLMAIPVVLGATLFEIPHVLSVGLSHALVVGMLVAFVVAYATIALFLRFIERVPFGAFVVYSVMLLVLTILVV